MNLHLQRLWFSYHQALIDIFAPIGSFQLKVEFLYDLLMGVDHHLLIGLLDVAVLVVAFLGAKVDHLEDAVPWLVFPGGSCRTG